jgi:hypothetical protein
MVIGTAVSINGVTIRLTDERWEHVLDVRPFMRGYEDDVLDAVADPEMILRVAGGALVAVVSFGRSGFLHVIYREVSRSDGFIITAYFNDSYNRRQVIWRASEE